MKAALADRQPALALTDTNNLFGALEFSEKAAGAGIQPIPGLQLTVAFEAPTGKTLQVVVLDDRGGAIFSGLEHATAPAPVLRRMFLTPQRLDSAALAHALGASHRRVAPDDLQFLDEPVVGRQVVSVPLT